MTGKVLPGPTRPRPGRWVVTGTLTGAPYPCRCHRNGKCRGPHNTDHKAYWCPCAGRPDAAKMHAGCCARRAHDTAQRLEGS